MEKGLPNLIVEEEVVKVKQNELFKIQEKEKPQKEQEENLKEKE